MSPFFFFLSSPPHQRMPLSLPLPLPPPSPFPSLPPAPLLPDPRAGQPACHASGRGGHNSPQSQCRSRVTRGASSALRPLRGDPVHPPAQTLLLFIFSHCPPSRPRPLDLPPAHFSKPVRAARRRPRRPGFLPRVTCPFVLISRSTLLSPSLRGFQRQRARCSSKQL